MARMMRIEEMRGKIQAIKTNSVLLELMTLKLTLTEYAESMPVGYRAGLLKAVEEIKSRMEELSKHED